MPDTTCGSDNKDNDNCGCSFILAFIFCMATLYMLNGLITDYEKQYKKEYQAKLKVCQEKEWVNTSMCKQFLFNDKVGQLEVRS